MRIVALFKDDGFANIEAVEFHEDGDFIKAYGEHNELVLMCRIDEIKRIHRSERNGATE